MKLGWILAALAASALVTTACNEKGAANTKTAGSSVKGADADEASAELALPSGDVCVALGGGHIAFIPLDGSPAVRGPDISDPEIGSTTWSLGLSGGMLYTCHAGEVFRIAPFDGHAKSTGIECQAVTADENGMYVLEGQATDEVVRHPVFGEEGPVKHLRRTSPFETLAVQGTTLLTAWHSTDRVYVGSFAGSATDVPLEGHGDNWVTGLSRLEDGRIVIGTWFDQSALRVFDATGRKVSEVSLASADMAMVNGIVCGRSEKLFPRENAPKQKSPDATPEIPVN